MSRRACLWQCTRLRISAFVSGGYKHMIGAVLMRTTPRVDARASVHVDHQRLCGLTDPGTDSLHETSHLYRPKNKWAYVRARVALLKLSACPSPHDAMHIYTFIQKHIHIHTHTCLHVNTHVGARARASLTRALHDRRLLRHVNSSWCVAVALRSQWGSVRCLAI
jgi:hypothetical protein